MFLALAFLTTAATPGGDVGDWLLDAKGMPFVYSPAGRRDPFLFTTRVPAARPIEVSEDSLDIIRGARGRFARRRTAGQDEKVGTDEQKLAEIINRARAELEVGNCQRSKSLAEQARRKVAEDHPPELMQMVERVYRAAELLTQRREAEQEFRKLALSIDAIFWNLDEPVAMINGRTHREGDVLDNELQVYRIEKGGVVFLFKNFLKVRKRLGWTFKSSKR